MRRLFIILMLTLLPLQAGWAAVCAYCPDNCVSESTSGAIADTVIDDAAALVADDDCSRCQLGGVGIASSPAAARIVPHLASFTLWDGSIIPDPGPAGRPERPNWTRAA